MASDFKENKFYDKNGYPGHKIIVIIYYCITRYWFSDLSWVNLKNVDFYKIKTT